MPKIENESQTLPQTAPQAFPLPQPNKAVTEFLQTRRSNMSKAMSEPGPNAAELSSLLTIAARVPDHRKLNPWRFVVFEGAARARFGEHIARAFAQDNPEIGPKRGEERIAFEAERLMRAPCVVAVISSPLICPRGTPEWEQVLSAGAVCYNLVLAAQAAGFAAQWLTEWLAYDTRINTALGLVGDEKIAGYIYMGTTKQQSCARARPDVADLVQHWE